MSLIEKRRILLEQLSKAKQRNTHKDKIEVCVKKTTKNLIDECKNIYHIKKVVNTNNLCVDETFIKNQNDIKPDRLTKCISQIDRLRVTMVEPKSWFNVRNVTKITNNDIDDRCTFLIDLVDINDERVTTSTKFEVKLKVLYDIPKIVLIRSLGGVRDDNGIKTIDCIVMGIRHY
jgi:hypothetical protein